MRLTLAFIACVAGVWGLARPPASTVADSARAPLLPTFEGLHWIGAAYQNLIADYYWVQTAHQAGEAVTIADYRNIAPYARLTTDLDPAFRYPYLFAAAVIPCALGNGRWANTAESTELLERALVRFPDNVSMRIMLAYNWSVYDRNYRRAARLLQETSKLPGAPGYLAALASRLFAQGGDVQAGLEFAQSIAQGTDDPETKAAMERRVAELQLEGELQAVDRAAAAFRLRTGAGPTSVSALVDAKDLDHLPVDPLGGILFLGQDGRAHSSVLDRRLEVYQP